MKKKFILVIQRSATCTILERHRLVTLRYADSVYMVELPQKGRKCNRVAGSQSVKKIRPTLHRSHGHTEVAQTTAVLLFGII